MSGEAISLYVSRLLGLLLTASDLALEITPAGEVVFAVDDIGEDAAHSKWVGRNWRSIVHVADHELVASALKDLKVSGRCGPYPVRRYDLDGVGDQPARLSAALWPHRTPNISLLLSAPPLPQAQPVGPQPESQPESEPLGLDLEAFNQRLPELVKHYRQLGEGVDLAMVELPGLADICEQAAGGSSAALSRAIADLLRARSVTGDMVAEVAPERFLVLCAKRPSADLSGLLLKVLAAAQADVQPKAVFLTVPRRLELSYALRALRLTVEQFASTGVADGGQDLLTSFNGRLTQTFDSAKAFVSMTTSRNFELVYQPVVSLRSGQIHHYEVLSRFPGGLDPFTLIQMAEELEIIVEFDIAVMQKAFSEMRQREQPPNLAINISARSFLQPGFIDRLLRLASAETRLKGSLMFEITESAALSDLELANTHVQRLRAAGYPVCLDDFGSGATSFSYLQALAVDTVKIDGQYIKNLTEGSRDHVLVRHLAMLCRELKINTIAEMVETQSNVQALRTCDIDLIQGYFVGRPGPLPLDKGSPPSRRVGITESWR